MLTKDSIHKLEQIHGDMKSEFNTQQQKRQSFERCDKYLQKTGDYSEETRKGESAVKNGDKTKMANIEIALTQQYKESAEAYMVGTFLTGNPIFSAVSNRKNEDTASMLTALTGRDQYRLGWVGHLSRCLDDALRYNICGAEVKWGTRTAINAATRIEEGAAKTGSFNSVVYEGNEIIRIDPYNLVYDLDVEPSKVHIDGAYAGYFEMKNYISFKRQFKKWNDVYIVKENIKTAFESNSGREHYFTPVIRKDNEIPNPTNNWTHFWGTNTKHNLKGHDGQYEFLTLYKRIIPKEYGVNVPNAGSPQVFKLVWVNSHLIYAEPVIAGHEYLPIVIGQVYPGRNDVKSFVEYLMPLQDLATATMSASLQSMRRAVSDRALYNPKRIRKADIEAEAPNSKVPVGGTGFDEDMRTAYYQIPFQDTISPMFNQQLGTIFSLAENETGLNKSAQGNFIKGNKTSMEFGTIMSNSQARLQLGAMRLGQSFFDPIKEILKLNYLVYAANEEVDNLATNTTVQIDPAMLRKQAPEFKMADGIMPSTKLANTEVLMQASQMFAQNPMAFMNYDIEGMLVSIIKQQGFHDVENYKRTPEQQRQFMQMMGMAQGGAQGGQGQGAPAAAAPSNSQPPQ